MVTTDTTDTTDTALTVLDVLVCSAGVHACEAAAPPRQVAWCFVAVVSACAHQAASGACDPSGAASGGKRTQWPRKGFWRSPMTARNWVSTSSQVLGFEGDGCGVHPLQRGAAGLGCHGGARLPRHGSGGSHVTEPHEHVAQPRGMGQGAPLLPHGCDGRSPARSGTSRWQRREAPGWSAGRRLREGGGRRCSSDAARHEVLAQWSQVLAGRRAKGRLNHAVDHWDQPGPLRARSFPAVTYSMPSWSRRRSQSRSAAPRRPSSASHRSGTRGRPPPRAQRPPLRPLRGASAQPVGRAPVGRRRSPTRQRQGTFAPRNIAVAYTTRPPRPIAMASRCCHSTLRSMAPATANGKARNT